MLDRQIERRGEDIVLIRLVEGGAAIERPHRAIPRGDRPSPAPGSLQQGETGLVLSPTDLPAEFADTEATRLSPGDKVFRDGRRREIETAVPVRLAGELVRINLTLKG